MPTEGVFHIAITLPHNIVREFFVYMARLTGNCKDFVFMVDYSPAGKTKFKRSKIMKRTNTRAMVECALMIALGTVLAQIEVWQMPYGGSVTLVSSLLF